MIHSIAFFVGQITTSFLVRDPNNEHDRNALKVINSSKQQVSSDICMLLFIQDQTNYLFNPKVGNIPSEITGIISPLIDSKYVRVEGVITGDGGKYSIPIAIHILGSRENEKNILSHFHNRGIYIKTRQVMDELRRGFFHPPTINSKIEMI